MIKKQIIPVILFLIGSFSSAFAASFVVEDDKIFSILGNIFNVYEFDGSLAACNQDIDKGELNESDDLTDIRLSSIAGATTTMALITIDDIPEDIVEIDVSACLLQRSARVEDCFARVDLDLGKMKVPCLISVDKIEGGENISIDEFGHPVVYEVEFTRRGNSSMNWAVDSVGKNLDIRPGKKHHEDDEPEEPGDNGDNDSPKGNRPDHASNDKDKKPKH